MWMNLLVGLALMIIGHILMPKPKGPKPPEVTDIDDPVAEAGKPIPVVFGTVTMTGLNVLWFGQKSHSKEQVNG